MNENKSPFIEISMNDNGEITCTVNISYNKQWDYLIEIIEKECEVNKNEWY